MVPQSNTDVKVEKRPLNISVWNKSIFLPVVNSKIACLEQFSYKEFLSSQSSSKTS